MRKIYWVLLAVVMMWGCVSFASGIVEKYNKLALYKEIAIANEHNIKNLQHKKDILVPSLMELTKTYLSHENSIYTSIIQKRGNIGLEDRVRMNSLIPLMMSVIDKYPELNGNAQITDMKNQLVALESDIVECRKDVNNSIMKYNYTIVSFPSSIIANIAGFKELTYMEVL